MALGRYIEEVVVSAISYHLMNNKDPEYRNGKLVISSKSLAYGLSIFQGKSIGNYRLKLKAPTEALKEAGTLSVGIKPESKSGIQTGTGTTNPEKTDVTSSFNIRFCHAPY
ncbi:Tyrosinase [Gossypium arboreum]|uniref:Tyrosinase n=1 Tax=Gossypium arboreum TaxID=29729 RepID=A0A0B0NRR1_GOSAR|nr:Tyrosinase [Gossypium arboreum]